jgi:23S rRNA (adenine2030-N6)-methyltransferase
VLSYRHAYHAGNHADVLKHVVWVRLLRSLTRKEKPLWVIDTHAGAGAYALAHDYAAKLAEYKTGIARLWSRNDLPELVADYVREVKRANPDGALSTYPGSPQLAWQLARAHDPLRFFELHGTDANALQQRFGRAIQRSGRPGAAAATGHASQGHAIRALERPRGAVKGPRNARAAAARVFGPSSGATGERRVAVVHGDGFAGLKALLPPPSRRGLVLIDPSYELGSDYRAVRDALADALERFATGTYAVWYPQLRRREAERLPEQLRRLARGDWLDVSLQVKTPPSEGYGLYGSGMFVFNPPWRLETDLHATMPALAGVLSQDDAARFAIAFRQT